jgi:inosose dehydratase
VVEGSILLCLHSFSSVDNRLKSAAGLINNCRPATSQGAAVLDSNSPLVSGIDSNRLTSSCAGDYTPRRPPTFVSDGAEMKSDSAASRRSLLKFLAAAAASRAFVPGLIGSALAQQEGVHSNVHFGVQLNAFPIDPKNFQTFLDALGQVKQIGYQGFESGFRYVNSQFANPGPARRQIEATGLTFFGVHIFLNTPMYDPATGIAPASLYEQVAHGGAALGARHLVLSGAPASDTEMLKRKIEALDKAGAYAKAAGLGLAYHNHWPEFESRIGEIEALYTRTDPSVVCFVLDAGHAYRGGADVPAFIRAHQKRIVAFHLRDYKNGKLVTLGTGTFPLKQVADTIKQIGWTGWVENEEERDDLSHNGAQVIEPAYRAMKEAFAS